MPHDLALVILETQLTGELFTKICKPTTQEWND